MRAVGHAARLLWLQKTAFTGRLRRDGVTLLINLVPEGFLLGGFPQATVVHDLLPLRYPEEYPRHQYYFRLLVPRVLRASGFDLGSGTAVNPVAPEDAARVLRG